MNRSESLACRGKQLGEAQPGRPRGDGRERPAVLGGGVGLGVVGIEWLHPPRSQTMITAVGSRDAAVRRLARGGEVRGAKASRSRPCQPAILLDATSSAACLMWDRHDSSTLPPQSSPIKADEELWYAFLTRHTAGFMIEVAPEMSAGPSRWSLLPPDRDAVTPPTRRRDSSRPARKPVPPRGSQPARKSCLSRTASSARVCR